MTLRPWHRAVAYALVGEQIELAASARPDVGRFLSDMAAAGWPAERIRSHAGAETVGGRAWPHPVPDALRRGLGAAQLFSAVREARASLGLLGVAPRQTTGRAALTADDRRLLEDRPPHYGR